MLSTWLKTLDYVRLVRGYGKVSESSFVARQGGRQSDMFRIVCCCDGAASQSSSSSPPPSPNVSLQDYHKAFLTCPLFQIELHLLSMVQRGMGSSTTTSAAHLDAVARGDEKCVGPWTIHAQEGDCAMQFGSDTPVGTSVTRVMQCRVQGEPFCDTWWSIEKNELGQVELVFGTDIRRYVSPGSPTTTGIHQWTIKSVLVTLLDPLHNVYSRLLLACAKAKLLEQQEQMKKGR